MFLKERLTLAVLMMSLTLAGIFASNSASAAPIRTFSGLLAIGDNVNNTSDLVGVFFSIDGDIPDGLKLSGSTGRIDWTPSEEQGPGEYALPIVVSLVDGEESIELDRVTLDVVVREVNRPPIIQESVIPAINLLKTSRFIHSIEVHDPDIPKYHT